MNCWEMRPESDNYNNLIFVDQSMSRLDFVDMFRQDRSLQEDWKPLAVLPLDPFRPLGDFPSLISAMPPVFSLRAVQTLSPLIGNDVEFLPLDFPDQPFYVANVRILDCLDREASRIKRHKSSGSIYRVEHYVFRDRCVTSEIFRVPELSATKVFVTSKFKQTVIDRGLQGLYFLELP